MAYVPENYEDNVKITTHPAILREPVLTLWASLQAFLDACVRLRSPTNDWQPKWWWCTHDHSSFLSHVDICLGGSGWARIFTVSVTPAHSVLSLYCMWPPSHVSRDSICVLENRGRGKKDCKGGQRNIYISAYIPLAWTKLRSCKGRWEM